MKHWITPDRWRVSAIGAGSGRQVTPRFVDTNCILEKQYHCFIWRCVKPRYLELNTLEYLWPTLLYLYLYGGGGDPLLLLLFILSVNVRALVKSAVTCVVLNLSYLKSLTGESLRKTSSHLHLEPSWARSHPSSSDTEGSVCVVDRRSHPVMFRPNLLSFVCSMFVCTLSLSRPKTLQKADDGCQKTLKTYLKLDWHNVRSSLYRREQPSTSLIPTGRH